jgi:phosphopantetheine--protein transferase-like protein
MAIAGVGVDIVNIPRIARIARTYGERFLVRAFHKHEIDKFNSLPESSRYTFLASR